MGKRILIGNDDQQCRIKRPTVLTAFDISIDRLLRNPVGVILFDKAKDAGLEIDQLMG